MIYAIKISQQSDLRAIIAEKLFYFIDQLTSLAILGTVKSLQRSFKKFALKCNMIAWFWKKISKPTLMCGVLLFVTGRDRKREGEEKMESLCGGDSDDDVRGEYYGDEARAVSLQHKLIVCNT